MNEVTHDGVNQLIMVSWGIMAVVAGPFLETPLNLFCMSSGLIWMMILMVANDPKARCF